MPPDPPPAPIESRPTCAFDTLTYIPPLLIQGLDPSLRCQAKRMHKSLMLCVNLSQWLLLRLHTPPALGLILLYTTRAIARILNTEG